MEMKDTLEFEMLRNTSVAEMVADEIIEEIDDFLKEVVTLAEAIEAEKPGAYSIAADGEETANETDKMMQTGDDLKLEIELPEEVTEPQAKITPLAEETESAIDALADVENEVMASLAKEAGVNDSGDSLSTVTDKDSKDKDTEKNLAEDAKANAGEASIPDGLNDHATTMLDKRIEATVTRVVEERLSGIVKSIVVEKLNRIFSSIG